MMRHPIFLTYGVLLLGFVSFANFRGLSPWRLNVSRASAIGSMRGGGHPIFVPGGGGGPHGK
jgi:hypothetical protein